MLQRGHPMRGRISSPYPESSPPIPVRAGVQERDGFTNLSEEAFLKYFANGVAHEKAEVLYAEQQPAAASLFGGRTTVAAWRSQPSWYAVSKLDQTRYRLTWNDFWQHA
jgi:hypothetical protein